MNEIITRVIALPIAVKGMTVKDEEDDYNIYLNGRLSAEEQGKAYRHEMAHLLMRHFTKNGSVADKEVEVSRYHNL